MSEKNPVPESWNKETLMACEGKFALNGVLQIETNGANPMYNNEFGYISRASFEIENFGKKKYLFGCLK